MNLRLVFLWILSILFIIWLQTNRVDFKACFDMDKEEFHLENLNKIERIIFSNASQLIFIGGPLKSGKSLMRTLLNSLPDIRCSKETRITKKILQKQQSWTENRITMNSLKNAGIEKNLINDAVASFILQLIIKNGKAAKNLCNVDSSLFEYSNDLNSYFPNSKFILMVRDGRAVAHMLTTGRMQKSLNNSLFSWNYEMNKAYKKCKDLGANKCLVVYYEKLILKSIESINRVLDFLNLNNNNRLSFVDESLISNDKDKLYDWFDKIPTSILDNSGKIAPMLANLGYDPKNYHPKYNNIE